MQWRLKDSSLYLHVPFLHDSIVPASIVAVQVATVTKLEENVLLIVYLTFSYSVEVSVLYACTARLFLF